VNNVRGGYFRFGQYKPPVFAVAGLDGLHPKIAAMTAFKQQTSLRNNDGSFVSPADPRIGIARVAPKENVEVYKGITIHKMPTGGYVTRQQFMGDRRVGGGRSNRRQAPTPLYSNTVAGMRRQIDNVLNTQSPVGDLGKGLGDSAWWDTSGPSSETPTGEEQGQDWLTSTLRAAGSAVREGISEGAAALERERQRQINAKFRGFALTAGALALGVYLWRKN
jgi:hypothetical protein